MIICSVFLFRSEVHGLFWLVALRVVGAFSYAQYFHTKLISLENTPRLYILFLLPENGMLMHQINNNLVKEHLYMLL
jgi:hypothetical protein